MIYFTNWLVANRQRTSKHLLHEASISFESPIDGLDNPKVIGILVVNSGRELMEIQFSDAELGCLEQLALATLSRLDDASLLKALEALLSKRMEVKRRVG